MRAQQLVELEHVHARPDRDGALVEVDFVHLVHALDVDQDPVLQRHGAVGEAGPAGTRDDGDALAVGELDDLGHLLGTRGQHDDLRHVIVPAVQCEHRRRPGAVVARGL